MGLGLNGLQQAPTNFSFLEVAVALGNPGGCCGFMISNSNTPTQKYVEPKPCFNSLRGLWAMFLIIFGGVELAIATVPKRLDFY